MPALSTSIKTQHLTWVDGARGLAVTGVLLFHFAESGGGKWLPPIFRFAQLGWVGVDLFFVLSGFLITRILANRHRGINGLAGFYRDRCLRIIPLYYTTLLVAFVAFNTIYTDQPERLQSFNQAIPLLIAFIQNWLPAQVDPIFVQLGMNHLWSLAVEVQFYLVWPLVLIIFPRRYWLMLALLIFIIAIGSRLYSMVVLNSSTIAYFSTITRLDAFMAGAMIASFEIRENTERLSAIGATIGLSMLGWCAISDQTLQPDGTWMASIGYTANAVIFSSFLLWMINGSAKTRVPNIMLTFTPFCRLGKISYGIYVLHYPLLFAAIHLSGIALGASTRIDMAFLILWITLTVILAELSYRILETPILKMKRSVYQ